MKRKLKRMLSFLAAMCIIIGMTPVEAFASRTIKRPPDTTKSTRRPVSGVTTGHRRPSGHHSSGSILPENHYWIDIEDAEVTVYNENNVASQAFTAHSGTILHIKAKKPSEYAEFERWDDNTGNLTSYLLEENKTEDYILLRMPYENLTGKAIFIIPSCQVKVIANGGVIESSTQDAIHFVKKGEQFRVPDENDYIPPKGFKFKGWAVNGTPVSFGEYVTITKDTEVRPLLDRIVPVISVDLNGGKLDGKLEKYKFEVKYGDKISLENNFKNVIPPVGARADYLEVGGLRYYLGSVFTAERDMSIKFFWKYASDFRFKVDGYKDYGLHKYGDQITVRAKEYDDKVFKSWEVVEGECDNFDLTSPVQTFSMPPCNFTVKPVYENRMIKVTYNLNGGEFKDNTSSMSASVLYGEAFIVPEYDDDMKRQIRFPDGYIYSGMQLNNVIYAPGEYVFLKEDTEGKFIWEREKICKVNVINGDGSGSYKYGEYIDVSVKELDAENEFDYWEISDENVSGFYPRVKDLTLRVPEKDYIEIKAHFKGVRPTLQIAVEPAVLPGHESDDQYLYEDYELGHVYTVPDESAYADKLEFPVGYYYTGMEIDGRQYHDGEKITLNKKNYDASMIWEPVDIKITGGTVSTSDDIIKITAPEKNQNGQIFNHWETVEGESVLTDDYSNVAQITKIKASDNGRLRITAIYENEKKTISYDFNGGVIKDMVIPSFYEIDTGAKIKIPTEFAVLTHPDEKAYYGVSVNGVFVKPGTEIVVSEDMLIKILWKYVGHEMKPSASVTKYYVTVKDGTSTEKQVPKGTEIMIMADPAPYGYVFDYWETDNSVNLEDANASITRFTMPEENVIITAKYKKSVVYPIQKGPATKNGRFEFTPKNATEGTLVKILTRPSENCRLDRVYVKANGKEVPVHKVQENEYHFVMPGSGVTVYADFVASGELAHNQHKVNVIGSYAYNSGDGIYRTDDAVIIRAGTRQGYKFAGWKVSDVELDDAYSSAASFKMPAHDVEVKAVWHRDEFSEKQSEYRIVIKSTYDGINYTNNPVNVQAGENITITIKPANGYMFKQIKQDGRVVGTHIKGDIDLVFYDVQEDHMIEVSYEKK